MSALYVHRVVLLKDPCLKQSQQYELELLLIVWLKLQLAAKTMALDEVTVFAESKRDPGPYINHLLIRKCCYFNL